MAVAQPDKKPRIRKSEPTMREQAEKARSKSTADDAKPRRIRKVAGGVKKPVSKAAHIGSQEFYLPMPKNRVGRFLNKRRRIIPRYFIDSWHELKLVTWPGRMETWRLTFAVFVFALVFGLLVAGVDKVLEEIFKKIILK